MSERNFARAFRKELGMTPGRLRRDRRAWRPPASRSSRRDTPVEAVARGNGFGTVETMRRAFHRRLGVGPADYRARFRVIASRLKGGSPMQIAIPLYDRFTALDAIGPYEVLSRIPGADLKFVGTEAGPYKTDNGMLTILAEASLDDMPRPDILCVPGGWGTRDAMSDERLVGWIRDVHETSQWTTSVCTGSLLLGAAGVLDGLDATSHWLELETLREWARARPSAAWWSRAR